MEVQLYLNTYVIHVCTIYFLYFFHTSSTLYFSQMMVVITIAYLTYVEGQLSVCIFLSTSTFGKFLYEEEDSSYTTAPNMTHNPLEREPLRYMK